MLNSCAQSWLSSLCQGNCWEDVCFPSEITSDILHVPPAVHLGLFPTGLTCLWWLFVSLRSRWKSSQRLLNYSWDGSQQTLNSTWGNPAVTLQLILPLNPTAGCVCVCVYLSLPIRSLFRWSTLLYYPSHRHVWTHKTACVKETTCCCFCLILAVLSAVTGCTRCRSIIISLL